MRVAELTGALLDYWVARAEGWELGDDDMWRTDGGRLMSVNGFWTPSKTWAQGGPIIERERIQLSAPPSGEWIGVTYVKGKLIAPEGPTPLVAAMRAYVASKFGDEVPDKIAHP